ncbi:hypothetical protein BpHYR1_039004 [Brachionus plicatilis]|uniref:Uncharacterized protein n=1 Tax=Brachionus plicatilis TaxID=10195 RepID=A0A3M7SGN5_BRAPC|nr:hypothetical protein BpHYR1_039004 [Brachionus plicatilis]
MQELLVEISINRLILKEGWSIDKKVENWNKFYLFLHNELPPLQRELYNSRDFLQLQRLVAHEEVQLHLIIPCPPATDVYPTACLTETFSIKISCLIDFKFFVASFLYIGLTEKVNSSICGKDLNFAFYLKFI